MKLKEENIKNIVESAMREYFDLTGLSLPGGSGAQHKKVSPYAQYLKSASEVLDRILDMVNDESVEIEKIDSQELLYQSIPRLLNKINAVEEAIERKSGFKSLQKTRPEPLRPPHERTGLKIKIK
jgi:signal transduction histidine kinase